MEKTAHATTPKAAPVTDAYPTPRYYWAECLCGWYSSDTVDTFDEALADCESHLTGVAR